MMKRACKSNVIGCGALVALLLTACGGGGGGGGGGGFTSPGVPGAANIRAVDLGLARTYFAGSTEPDLTAEEAHSQIEQTVGRIQGDTNHSSLLLSDVSLFTTRDDLNLPVRLDAGLPSGGYLFDLLGEPLAVGVEDLSLGSVASLRPVMRHRGILLVGRAEAIRAAIPMSGGASYPGWIDYSRFPIVSEASGDVFGYGGWLDYSGFFVEGLPILSGDARGISVYYGVSTGVASHSRPTGGSASWIGVMVATDVSGPGRENIIQGDADLSIHSDVIPTCIDPPCVSLSFSNVWDNRGQSRPGTTWWAMPVTAAGRFSGTNRQGETEGRFYGPAHEEAGGTFTYDDLVGAYGLKRQ